jgi:hypothetical protein
VRRDRCPTLRSRTSTGGKLSEMHVDLGAPNREGSARIGGAHEFKEPTSFYGVCNRGKGLELPVGVPIKPLRARRIRHAVTPRSLSRCRRPCTPAGGLWCASRTRTSSATSVAKIEIQRGRYAVG